jgi:rubrerythrin
MSDRSRTTGTQDEHYNLVSVLYHALQGGEVYDQYIADAESAGDDELAKFFRDVQSEERDRAQRAKSLLGARLGGS